MAGDDAPPRHTDCSLSQQTSALLVLNHYYKHFIKPTTFAHACEDVFYNTCWLVLFIHIAAVAEARKANRIKTLQKEHVDPRNDLR